MVLKIFSPTLSGCWRVLGWGWRGDALGSLVCVRVGAGGGNSDRSHFWACGGGGPCWATRTSPRRGSPGERRQVWGAADGDTWEPLGAAWLFRALEKSLQGVGLPGKARTVAPCGCAPSRLRLSSLRAALGSPVHTHSPVSHENGAGEAGLGAPRRRLSGPVTGTWCWTPSVAGGTAGRWSVDY